VFLSYQILRNLAPETPTTSQQRAADEQLGEMAAALSRRGRTRWHAHGRRAGRVGSGGLTLRRISKAAPKTAC
jgi:hypothetical protein